MKLNAKDSLIISILIPMAAGSISSLISQSDMTAYLMLKKPALSPPGILFPVVWTILYILMGISSWLVYRSDHPLRNSALTWYAVQLTLNFFWSILFFNFSWYLAAFIWLVLLIAAILVMICLFRRISPAAALLQIPYLLWCLFAAYLNLSIFLLNR